MTTPAAHLREALRREIIDHCLRELPNEGCGLLAVDEGEVVAVYPTSNEDASPTAYTVPPDEHYRILVDVESLGWAVGGVFHSHPKGPATFSQTDLDQALEPGWIYVVVGLAGDTPELSLRYGRSG